MNKTVKNAKATIIKRADGWWVRVPDGSLRGKSKTVHGATEWAEKNGYADWVVENADVKAVVSKDRVVNSALRHVAKNAWFCKDEEVLYKGKPAVVRSLLPDGNYMVEVGGKRVHARGNELSAPWTNGRACNAGVIKPGVIVKVGFSPSNQSRGIVGKTAEVLRLDGSGNVLLRMEEDSRELFTDKTSVKVANASLDELLKKNGLSKAEFEKMKREMESKGARGMHFVRGKDGRLVYKVDGTTIGNEYPRYAANGVESWTAQQCAQALKSATDEVVKLAAADARVPLMQKCAKVEARSRGIVINDDPNGDSGKCTTCEFGCYKRPNMMCKRGYDPKITNGKCKYWCADSMTRAVSNMSTQQAITAVEMLLGSDDSMDHDEALAILQHHRGDIEREVGTRQYGELYRRANNAKARKS